MKSMGVLYNIIIFYRRHEGIVSFERVVDFYTDLLVHESGTDHSFEASVVNYFDKVMRSLLICDVH